MRGSIEQRAVLLCALLAPSMCLHLFPDALPQIPAVEDFFTGDDGTSVLSSGSRTSTRMSMDSLATIAGGSTLVMHLEVLCSYIRDHKSLSSATIQSASTYRQRSSLVVRHRFLVLHLRREGKRDVWLRLDRLRSEEKDLMGFVAAGAQVNSNDIVSQSTLASKE